MKRIISILLFVSLFDFEVQAQNAPPLTSSQTIQISKLKAKVEANPSNLEAHHAFIDACKLDDPSLKVQYKVPIKLQKQKSLFLPFLPNHAAATFLQTGVADGDWNAFFIAQKHYADPKRELLNTVFTALK